MTTPGGAGTPPKGLSHFPLGARLTGFYHGVGASWSTWLRPFVINRNICNFLWYGGFVRGVVGEGLRSVEVTPSPNQERVLYPARRSPFKGRGILRGVGPFIWSVGAKEGRPRPLQIRQPTQRRTY
jgi:hypothetical protein